MSDNKYAKVILGTGYDANNLKFGEMVTDRENSIICVGNTSFGSEVVTASTESGDDNE